MTELVLKKPEALTFESFCDLVNSVALEKGFKNQHTAATHTGLSNSRWYEIYKKRNPGFETLSDRAKRGWAQSIVRICKSFDLDTTACLKAVGLSADLSCAVETERVSRDFLLGETELNALLELIKLTGKPVPLSFAREFLAMRK